MEKDFQFGHNKTNSRNRFFKKKPQELFHPNLYFNKFVVKKVQVQKSLGHKQDKKISFKDHLKGVFKVNWVIGISKKKWNGFLTPDSLITLSKSFIRPHLDYADNIYYQPDNLNLFKKVETCRQRSPTYYRWQQGFLKRKTVPGTRLRVYKFIKVVQKTTHLLYYCQ